VLLCACGIYQFDHGLSLAILNSQTDISTHNGTINVKNIDRTKVILRFYPSVFELLVTMLHDKDFKQIYPELKLKTEFLRSAISNFIEKYKNETEFEQQTKCNGDTPEIINISARPKINNGKSNYKQLLCAIDDDVLEKIDSNFSKYSRSVIAEFAIKDSLYSVKNQKKIDKYFLVDVNEQDINEQEQLKKPRKPKVNEHVSNTDYASPILVAVPTEVKLKCQSLVRNKELGGNARKAFTQLAWDWSLGKKPWKMGNLRWPEVKRGEEGWINYNIVITRTMKRAIQQAAIEQQVTLETLMH
jgi:hypothetical protein